MKLAFLLALAAGCTPCRVVDGVEICGDLPDPSSVTAGMDGAVWPAAIDADGNALLTVGGEVLRIGADGSVETLETGAASAPVLAGDGTLYFSGDNLVNHSGDQGWSTSMSGVGGLPPSLGVDHAYVADQTDLTVLDRTTGVVQRTLADTSGAGIADDGSLRVLAGRLADGVFSTLHSLDATGATEQWTLEEPGGLVDFSVGADGHTYVVTESGSLVRVDGAGAVVWRYTPECDTCVVGGAPTVTEDTLYVPVWEAASSADGCANPVDDALSALIDPLHAVDIATAELLWSFDGFTTSNSELALDNVFTDPLGGPLDTVSTRHHPGGRPTVAADGTSIVGADGGLAVLNDRGKSQGTVIWAADEGETFVRCGLVGANAWVRPGVVHAPILSANGTLWTLGGGRLFAFETDYRPAVTTWVAPFGTTANDGHAGR